jgi:hypothetical protein
MKTTSISFDAGASPIDERPHERIPVMAGAAEPAGQQPGSTWHLPGTSY